MKKTFIILILAVIAAGIFFLNESRRAQAPEYLPPNSKACTEEAKQCPDGSYVGRTGPMCEFAECPKVNPAPTPISAKSGISGNVVIGPTCPVERTPPEPGCAPKGYATSIHILKSGSATEIKTIQSNEAGMFSVEIAPGTYTLQAMEGKIFPRCGEVTVTVKQGVYTKTEISCDSGIR